MIRGIIPVPHTENLRPLSVQIERTVDVTETYRGSFGCVIIRVLIKSSGVVIPAAMEPAIAPDTNVDGASCSDFLLWCFSYTVQEIIPTGIS